jgi:cytidine deaminase
MNKMDANIANLIKAARNALPKAYAPHSDFSVGAALRTRSGKVFAGCNVENISFGLTMCAERVCVGSAIAAGERELEAIAIVAASREPIVPCGACRQVLAEFNPSLTIYSATSGDAVSEFHLGDLLPRPRQGILRSDNA